MLEAVQKYPALTSGVFLLGCILYWLWTNVLSDKIAEIGKRRIDKAVADSKKLDKLYEANRYQLHDEMQVILDECYRKGGITTYDISKFGFIYSTYKSLGGNHDGDILLKKFEALPLIDTMEMPIKSGDEYNINKDKYQFVYEGHYKEQV